MAELGFDSEPALIITMQFCVTYTRSICLWQLIHVSKYTSHKQVPREPSVLNLLVYFLNCPHPDPLSYQNPTHSLSPFSAYRMSIL